jgi:hypothetical protein
MGVVAAGALLLDDDAGFAASLEEKALDDARRAPRGAIASTVSC